jgi:uncharacterized protein YyaL (SSP411 family)
MHSPTPGAPPNRLASESSPYLRQHAFNPVEWWPWGEAAIAEARQRECPIFLSIGYSTCYWCHVMARESFENPETAAALRRGFVSVKVDREERPDLDEIMMAACVAFTRLVEGRSSGGWPLTVFLEPRSLKPFFAGTYFPPRPAHGRPSFPDLLHAIEEAWRSRRHEIAAQSERLGTIVADSLSPPAGGGVVPARALAEAADALLAMEDRRHGGFGAAPKFPQPVHLRVLEEASIERPAIAAAIRRALDAFSLGGLQDHLGGGFHRYCVDASWTVPHFEKMLYDNGQLACSLAASLRRQPDRWHARTLRRTLEWMLREMRSPEGGFFAAIDAEVDAREGASYLWNPEQVEEALAAAGRSDLRGFARSVWDLDGEPPFEDPHHPKAPRAWVLRLAARPEALADRMGLALDEFERRLDAAEAALLAARSRREQPAIDEKVLASWNGLAIAGLAEGGAALGSDGARFIDAARSAAGAVLDRLFSTGRLLRVRSGTAAIEGVLEDHALLASGLLSLVRVGADPDGELLAAAKAIAERAEEFFADPAGGWFDTPPGRQDLFVRPRTLDDGAVPSGSGTMLLVHLDLHASSGERRHLELVERALGNLSAAILASPVAASLSVIAAARLDRVVRSAPSRAASRGPVRARLEPPQPRFSRKGAAAATLILEIDPPYHIAAHEPGEPGLRGLRVAGSEGSLEVDAAYPKGDLSRESLRIHAREVRIPLELRRPGSGAAAILVQVQACSDRECLAPQTIRLEIP